MQSMCQSAPRRARKAAAAVLGVLLALAGPAGRADMGMGMLPCPMVQAHQPQDLTALPLDQLVNLDVIPVNVTGTHTHLSHEVMLGARLMTVRMNGNRDGGRAVGVGDVLARYPVAHTDMTMTMAMFDAMYAPSDAATLMVMLPYKDMAMNHVTRAGVHYATYASGFGDLSLMGNYTFYGNVREGGNRLLFNAGVSLPTGSISKTYDTPTRHSAPLEYPMELGSGTYDLMPGITYLGSAQDWAWGAQAMATDRLGTNADGYRFGNELHLNAWGYYRISDWLGPSLRLEYSTVGRIHGRDPRLDPTVNSAYDPAQQGGRRLDLILGLDVYAPKGRYKGNRITLEYGRPLFQHLNGLQLNNDWEYTVGWSDTFRP